MCLVEKDVYLSLFLHGNGKNRQKHERKIETHLLKFVKR